MRLSRTILPFLLAFGPAAWSAELRSYTGFSASEIVDGKLTLFAGMAGSCTSTTATCNTCDGSGLNPCNLNSVNPSLILSLELVSTNSSLLTSGPSVELKSAAKNATVSGVTFSTISNGVVTAQVPYNALCGFIAGDTACTTDFSDTLTFRIFKDSVEDKAEFKIVFSHSGSGDQFADLCPPDSYGYTGPGPTSNHGFCFVDMEPGDSKAYAVELSVPPGFPAAGTGSGPGATEVKYSKAVIFYSTAGLSAVNNASSSVLLNVDASQSTPVSDTRVNGLSNGAQYCFILASQDNTGNISHFTRTTDFTSSTNRDEALCTTPQLVVGLLDDKKCFIATAAWGSAMEPHVKTFRQFRDQELLSWGGGRAFVKTYYEKGEGVARWIRAHEGLRAAARVLLWPLWLFAKFALVIGLPLALLFSAGLLVTPLWWRHRRRRGGLS